MSEPRSTPSGLDARGSELWERITKAAKLDEAGEELLLEACRALDRAERLHWLISGDASTWAHLVPDPLDGCVYTLQITGAMAEARQQQQIARALLGQLKLGRVATEPSKGGSKLDELAARRAGRGATAAHPGRPASDT